MLRDILLHLGRLDARGPMADPMLDEDGRLALSARLARTSGARLTALVTHQHQAIPAGAMSWAMGPLVVTAARSRRMELDRLDQRFTRWAAGRSLTEARFLALEGDGADSILSLAPATDLIVMAAHDDRDATARGLCGRVVVGAGVPVLLLPSGGARPEMGRRILVAWNDSREAARAVRDALPLLRGAERVDIVTIGRQTASPARSAAGLADHLIRHGLRRVRPVELSYDAGCGVAGCLLDHARAMGADLIVSGGFGRSWLGETIGGSTTFKLVSSSQAPLLVSC